MPLGLKAAIKSELAAKPPPSRIHSVVPSQAEMPGRLRQFLLIPGPDGREPPPMCEITAPFLGILLLPPGERQQLMMALFELLALISGLILPLPLMLLHGSDSESAEDAWAARPRIEEVRDGLAILISFMLALIVFNSIAHAIFIATTGWHNTACWYDAISTSAMFMFITLVFGCILPLFALLWWQLFTAAVSPYPLLAAIVLGLVFNVAIFHLHWYSHTIGLALELYHLPHWFRNMARFVIAPTPTIIRTMSFSALQPKARQRAAELRVLAARLYDLDASVVDGAGGCRLETTTPTVTASGTDGSRAKYAAWVS